jgi:site-specific DNA-methyltransferase (adenine-specific)
MKILDTHLGSGSSRISAHKAKLDFVGCELHTDYFNAAGKRYQQFISQLTIF